MSQLGNKTICEQLFYDFRKALTWKWDDWVGSFLAEFNVDQESGARNGVGSTLSSYALPLPSF